MCAHAVNGALGFFHWINKEKNGMHTNTHVHTITIHVLRVRTENFMEWRTYIYTRIAQK